jgi:glycosyltransferase involved in cell wall biosynthesis
MRRERPLIVHTHTSKAGFIGRAAARLARVPAVIHQPHGHIFYGYWGPRRTALYITLERCAARWTDTIVTLTGRGMEEHLAHGIGRRSQYAVVPSGVPTTALRARRPGRAAVRARLGIPADAFVIVAVGRLVAVKGFDVAVRALSRLRAAVPSATLLLVGDGPERHALEAQARAEGVAAAVRTTGVVDDVLPFLAGADVLAAPSRNEGMGRSIVEAMALGLPVVATRVGGIPDVVGEGETGRLVPVEDAAALATALIELASDPPLRAKLGDAAMDRAERFSADEANRRMRDVYAALIRAKGLARPS